MASIATARLSSCFRSYTLEVPGRVCGDEARSHQDLPCYDRCGERGPGGLSIGLGGPPRLRDTAQITRADASPDWTRGSITGSVSGLPTPTHHVWNVRAYVAPNGAACHPKEFPDSSAGLTRMVWESHVGRSCLRHPRCAVGHRDIASHLHLWRLRVSLSGRECWTKRSWRARSLTVPPPPATSVPTRSREKSAVTLRRGTALSKARSALKKRSGRHTGAVTGSVFAVASSRPPNTSARSRSATGRSVRMEH